MLAGRRIGLLTPWASRDGGGVFEAVALQAQLIRAMGATPVVIALADAHSAADRKRLGDAEVHLAPLHGPRFFGYSRALVPLLVSLSLDCLHLHGIWMYPSHAARRWQSATGKAYVISPHGMLDPWITARGRWKKALAQAAYERASWRAASAFHALTDKEASDIAARTGRRDSVVIANPAPPLVPSPTRRPAPHFVYIGRIHPKKNLSALVEAWGSAQSQLPPDARLAIAGWGDEETVASLRAQLQPFAANAHFLGPVFGAEKEALLASARFVVLPSHSEGLPMAMLEAWAQGVPTIMNGNCNLPIGFATGAAIDCGVGSPTIAQALALAANIEDAAWLAMSGAARALAAGPFSAETVAQAWAECYGRAISAAERKS